MREVHADRIVNPAGILVVVAQVEGGLGRRAGFFVALVGLRIIDQLDALLFQQQEELVELHGVHGIIVQLLMKLAIGQVALLDAGFDKHCAFVLRDHDSLLLE